MRSLSIHTPRVVPAGRSERFMAQCVDAIVAAGPSIALAILQPNLGAYSTVVTWVGGAWAFFHIVLADGMPGGQSFGKQIFDIRVVDANTGEPCTFAQSFVRNILLSFLGPIDWVFIFGERHQRLGDRVADTIVIPVD